MHRIIEIMIPRKTGGTSGGDESDDRRVILVGISSGLAAGRNQHLKGNAQIEWWSLFTTVDQLDTCLADDSLHFRDPVLFAQVKRELEHVIRKPCTRGVDSRPRPSAELCGASP